jgi:hypothetical protein
MFSYDALCRRPTIFPALTGMTRAEFDTLTEQFVVAERELRNRSRTTRRDGTPRITTPGAGHPYDHTAVDRLLMALIWLRIYPTYELLGFFFELHRRNAQLNVRHVLEVLDSMSDFPLDRPDPNRPKLRTVDQVIAAFPQVRFIVDAKEQRINKPHGEAEQKPYYSGKKKAHTLKTQIVVNLWGQIETVSDSCGGSKHDIIVLDESGVMNELEGGAMMDKGYQGAKEKYPDVPVVVPFKKPRGGELTASQKTHNRVVAKHRIVVEHTMAQLNRFTCLRQVFRGKKRDRHSQVVRVVAKVLNRRLAVKPVNSKVA